MALSFVSYLTGGGDKILNVAQVGLELPVVLFSLSPVSWDHRHAAIPILSTMLRNPEIGGKLDPQQGKALSLALVLF